MAPSNSSIWELDAEASEHHSLSKIPETFVLASCRSALIQVL